MTLKEKLQSSYFVKDGSFKEFDERCSEFKPEMIRQLQKVGFSKEMATFLFNSTMKYVGSTLRYKESGIRRWTVGEDSPSAVMLEFGRVYDILNEMMRQMGKDLF